MHPDKYSSYERPVLITAKALPALKGYVKAYDNVSGEQALSVFLRQHKVPMDKAALATMGWGGDRIVVFTPQGHKGKIAGTVGVHYTVWDETADAIEFFEAMTNAMPFLAGGKKVSATAQRVEYRTRSGAIAVAQQVGDVVLLVVGAPPARADDVLAQARKLWKRHK